MTPGLRMVIFDVDGTLVDSQNNIVASMNAAFASVDRLAPTRTATLGIVGLSLPEAIAVLEPKASSRENAAMVAAYKESYMKLRTDAGADASPLYPGARAALERLRGDDHLFLGIATGKSRRGLDLLLDLHGLTGFFDNEQVSDHHPSKPHPAMLGAALSETGIEAQRAVMVGDTEFDMAMAKSAGMAGIGVTRGYHDKSRLGDAHKLIDEFDALDSAVADILGAPS